MRRIRPALVTAAAVCAAAAGGGAIASAASSGSSSSSTSTSSAPAPPHGGAPPGPRSFDPSKGGHSREGKTETLLTGTVAEKVRAAALEKVSGTVQRVETNVDDSVPYEAHIVKSDGTQVVVEVNSDYTVASVNTMGPGH